MGRFGSLWVLGLAAAGCAGGPIALDAGWIEARTPHFVIWSALDEARTRALARDVELFRDLVARSTGGTPLDPRVPTYVYAFGSNRSFAPFSFGGRAAGIFRPGMRDNRLALNASSGIDALAILKHEYVHFLLRNGSVLYPAWYDEGFAEFLATAVFGDGSVEVGRAPRWRLRALTRIQWVPLGRVLNAERTRMTRQDWGTFYAEAWALVHYLHFGRGGDRRVRDDLGAYLEATAGGMPAVDAAELAFGLSVRELDYELRVYVDKGRFPYHAFRLESRAPGAVEVAPLAPERIALELGWLALGVEEPEAARGYFEAARAAGAAGARLQAGLGVVEQLRERPEAAAGLLEAAVAASPDDPLGHLDYALFLHERARHAGERGDAAEQAELLARARQHYLRSRTLDAGIPETHARFGETFLLDGEDPARALEPLERAHGLLRSNLEIALLLARAYAAVGRGPEARQLASRVVGWTHDDEQREEAEGLLDALDGSS